MLNVSVIGVLAGLCFGFCFAAERALADPDLLSVGAGGTDVLNQQARAAADFRLEYRSGISLLPFLEGYLKMKPWAGIETTSRQSIWGGGGIWLDIPIGRHWVLSPNEGVGAYGQGNGKALGSVVEFRSAFEAGYVFDNGSRLVADFSHISNAGITRRNPGTEAATISYQIPLTLLMGR